MRDRVIVVGLAVFLVALAVWLRQRDRAMVPRKQAESLQEATGGDSPESADRYPEGKAPEDAVNRLFDAGSRGDDEAYLELVGGDLRRSLENDRAEQGPEAFRQTLRRWAAGIKGVAITRNTQSRSDLVALDVEIIFTDRNEKQTMFLVRQDDDWVITRIETATMIKPPVPYGTPVFDEEAWQQSQTGEDGSGAED